MGERRGPEAWTKIATPEEQRRIIEGVVRTAMAMGDPNIVGGVLSGLDSNTADAIGYIFSGAADGDTVKAIGEKLQGDIRT